MTTGNKVGSYALLLFVVAAFINYAQYESSPALSLSVACQWLGMFMFLYAGSKGSRWWFAIPVATLFTYFWAITRGH